MLSRSEGGLCEEQREESRQIFFLTDRISAHGLFIGRSLEPLSRTDFDSRRRRSDADMRRGLAEAVKELKAEIASSRQQGGESYSCRDPNRDDWAMRRGNGYDDGGFFHYMNSGREKAQRPSPSPSPPGGWLGGADSKVHSPLSPPAPARDSPPVPAATWSATATAGYRNDSSPSAAIAGGPSGIVPAGPAAAMPDSTKLRDVTEDRSAIASNPTYPQSFHEVMEMVSKGITPPNVRTDINDKPPDPTRVPSEPKTKPLPKPWEREHSLAGPLDSGIDLQSSASPRFSTEASSKSTEGAMNSSYNGVSNGTGGYVTSGGAGHLSSLPRVGSPSVVGSPSLTSARSASLPPYGGGTSIYAPTILPQDEAPGATPSVGSPSPSVLSVLQPLVAGGSSWKPPSPPAPTILLPAGEANQVEGIRYPPASSHEDGGSVISRVEIEA